MDLCLRQIATKSGNCRRHTVANSGKFPEPLRQLATNSLPSFAAFCRSRCGSFFDLYNCKEMVSPKNHSNGLPFYMQFTFTMNSIVFRFDVWREFQFYIFATVWVEYISPHLICDRDGNLP